MRYPFSALVEALNVAGEREAFRRLGMLFSAAPSKRPVYLDRGLSERDADRLATRAGLHPFEVWPEMLEHRVEEAEAERRAKVAARQRRYRARNAHARQANREQSARYYAECGDYARAQVRRYYWQNPERERARKRAERARKRVAA